MAIEEQKIKSIAIRSEYFQDILDKIPSWISRWANTLIFIIFFIIALGMKYIKYPDTIISEAIVTTDNPPVEVYSRTSGRIISILKTDQEKVKKGDWIIILNNSANYKDILKIDKILKSIRQENFWDSVSIISLPENLNLGDCTASYFQFSKSIEEFLLFKEVNSQVRQLDINYRRVSNLISLEQKTNNQLTILENELTIVKADFDRATNLYKDQVIAKPEVEQKEIVYLNLKDRVESLKGDLINIQLQEKVLEKENTQIDVEKNNSYFNLRSNILKYYNDLTFNLSEWENKYILLSPIDGSINFFEIRLVDQFLSNEQKIFTIAPEKSQNYYAIIKLPIANSGKVEIGQKCIIKLRNYPYTEFGMLTGNIFSISKAAKEGFYSVRVKLPNQLKTTMNKNLESKSELIGESEVIIEDLTLFDRIFNILISKNY